MYDCFRLRNVTETFYYINSINHLIFTGGQGVRKHLTHRVCVRHCEQS
jgi:hypothetical protein